MQQGMKTRTRTTIIAGPTGNLEVAVRRNVMDSNAEFHEGKRVMYVPPSRRKFYKEWQTVRPNAEYVG